MVVTGLSPICTKYGLCNTVTDMAKRRPLVERYISAFRYRDFTLLWLGSLSANSAYWALIVARGVLVLDVTNSATSVGIVTFAAMMPRFVVPPVAGYLSDRFTRRKVLVSSYTINLLLGFILASLVFNGDIKIWQLVTLSVLDGSARTFHITATQALVPNLIPKSILNNAVALNYATVHGSRLIGPGIIAPLMMMENAGHAFLAAALFYGISLVVASCIRTHSSGGIKKGQSIFSGMVEASSYVWNNATLKMLILLVALHCSLTMSFESLLPTFSKDVIQVGGVGMNYLMMAVGGGAFVAVLYIAGVRNEKTRGKLLLITGILSSVSLLLLAMSPNLVFSVLASFFMGGSQSGFMAITHSLIQSLSPDSMRGRINGINQVNVGGSMALVNLINGFMVDIIGADSVLYILGLLFMVVILMSLKNTTLRNLYTSGLIEPKVPTRE